MRILFLHPTYTFGGAERTAYNLLSNLDRQRFRITLVTSRRIAGHFSDIALEKVVCIEDLGIDVWCRPVTFANLSKFWKDVKVIKTLVLKESPDIAFGMMYYASALLAIAKKRYGLRTKVISSPRGPLNAYLNTFYAVNSVDRFFWKLNFYSLCHFADGVVAASEGTRSECIEDYKADPMSAVVVHNGIDAKYVGERALEDADISIPSGYYVISTAGRLAYEKNLPLLFEALSILKESEKIKLLIIGDGPQRKELEERTADFGIRQDVLFLGFQENPYKFIRRSDLFVHTCMLEGFGNVIVEAMACGVPVIATDCPYGPREIIRDRESGILVPANDVHALAHAMRDVLHDRDLRETFSRNAIRRASAFSVERMVKGYADFFERMMKSTTDGLT
ncbi:MAG: glycosyltransferase [Thermodesulfovibrionales bacterium]|nr:glycosyltransferase [Thermodesulfovibrionales bacterium]